MIFAVKGGSGGVHGDQSAGAGGFEDDVLGNFSQGLFGQSHHEIGPHGGDDSPGVGYAATRENERRQKGDEGDHQTHHKEQRCAGYGTADDLTGYISVIDLPAQYGQNHRQHMGKGEAPKITHGRPSQDASHAGEKVDQAWDAKEGETEPVNQGIDDFQNDKADFHDEPDGGDESVVDRPFEQVVIDKFEQSPEITIFEKKPRPDIPRDGRRPGVSRQHIPQSGISLFLRLENFIRRFHGCVDAFVIERAHTGEQENGNGRPFEQPDGVDTGKVFGDQGDHEHPRQQPHEKEPVTLHQVAGVDAFDQKNVPDHCIHSL